MRLVDSLTKSIAGTTSKGLLVRNTPVRCSWTLENALGCGRLPGADNLTVHYESRVPHVSPLLVGFFSSYRSSNAKFLLTH